jgi:hypothetical protein
MINIRMRLLNCSGPVDCANNTVDINKLRIRLPELARATELQITCLSEEPHVLRSLAPSIS